MARASLAPPIGGAHAQDRDFHLGQVLRASGRAEPEQEILADDALSNYDWGVHPDEASIVLAPYDARGGLSWEAGLRGTYYLTKRARLAVAANYERLQHSVELSPIVAENHVFGYFAGVAWSF